MGLSKILRQVERTPCNPTTARINISLPGNGDGQWGRLHEQAALVIAAISLPFGLDGTF